MFLSYTFVTIVPAADEYELTVVTLPLMARPNTGLDGFKLRINDSQAAALRSSKDGRPLSINASS